MGSSRYQVRTPSSHLAFNSESRLKRFYISTYICVYLSGIDEQQTATFYSFLFSPPNQTNHHSLTSPPSENLPSVCLESISRPLILCKLPPLSCQGSALAQPTSVSSSSFLFLLHYGINGTVCVLQVYFGRTESSMSGLV